MQYYKLIVFSIAFNFFDVACINILEVDRIKNHPHIICCINNFSGDTTTCDRRDQNL